MSSDLHFDFQRVERIGFAEAVLCSGKSSEQLDKILSEANERQASLLMTRLSPHQYSTLPAQVRDELDYHESSATAFFGAPCAYGEHARIAIISAGTSDISVVAEAQRTLQFHGVRSRLIGDIGVAGLWRLDQYLDELRTFEVVIVVAGMDGALASVVGGLLGSLIIAVPTSTGYGAARNGETALHAVLTSCAPGVLTVNIDNGYGAAIAALRASNSIRNND